MLDIILQKIAFKPVGPRGGIKSLIIHVTCTHTNVRHHGCVPHNIVAVLKLKNCRILKESLA